MFKWFIEWRRQRLFNRGFAEAAQIHFNDGELSYRQLEDCLAASKNKKAMKAAQQQLMSDPDMLGGIKDWNWETIRQWFTDYFIPAMRIILPIVMAFMQTGPDDE